MSDQGRTPRGYVAFDQPDLAHVRRELALDLALSARDTGAYLSSAEPDAVTAELDSRGWPS